MSVFGRKKVQQNKRDNVCYLPGVAREPRVRLFEHVQAVLFLPKPCAVKCAEKAGDSDTRWLCQRTCGSPRLNTSLPRPSTERLCVDQRKDRTAQIPHFLSHAGIRRSTVLELVTILPSRADSYSSPLPNITPFNSRNSITSIVLSSFLEASSAGRALLSPTTWTYPCTA